MNLFVVIHLEQFVLLQFVSTAKKILLCFSMVQRYKSKESIQVYDTCCSLKIGYFIMACVMLWAVLLISHETQRTHQFYICPVNDHCHGTPKWITQEKLPQESGSIILVNTSCKLSLSDTVYISCFIWICLAMWTKASAGRTWYIIFSLLQCLLWQHDFLLQKYS